MMRLNINKNKGFTLIELLTTITVVGILASISFAAFDEYKRKAYDTAAVMASNQLMESGVVVEADLLNKAIDKNAYAYSGGIIGGTRTTPYWQDSNNTLGPKEKFQYFLTPFLDKSDLLISVSVTRAPNSLGDYRSSILVFVLPCKGGVALSKGRYVGGTFGSQGDILNIYTKAAQASLWASSCP